MEHINPPVDWRLKDTGSYENLFSGRDKETPPAWASNGHASEK
jgi:hypothetical protein